jgi:ACS family hexuronate transporter-like MFS transporter
VSADPAPRYRWLLLCLFVLSTAINYLDRMTLAALAPLVRRDLQLSNTEYGWIVSGFSVLYACAAPFAGMLIDRIGLNRSVTLAVGVWSVAGIATGLTRGLAGLVACRGVLGLAEAAGIPAAAKAIHQFLRPAERGLGNALNQTAVSLGWLLAAPLATWIALSHGWRAAFLITGTLGPLWILAWRRAAPPDPAPTVNAAVSWKLLRDPRLWAFAAANALNMIGYSLWTNWTTVYLVEVHHLSLAQAAWYAWIPPVFAAAGGFAGGALSLRFIERGVPPVRARFRVCLLAAVLALFTAAIPSLSSAAFVCAAISLSIFAISAFSVNNYTLPLDAFGASRAAFGVSILVSSYGAAQFVVSPAIGWMMDHHAYAGITTAAAITPLLACAVLWPTRVQA